MLYLVPPGADDDWYWIYATVTEGRKNAAYVVGIHPSYSFPPLLPLYSSNIFPSFFYIHFTFFHHPTMSKLCHTRGDCEKPIIVINMTLNSSDRFHPHIVLGMLDPRSAKL